MIDKLKPEIEAHFALNYPREGCGLIGVVKGRYKWFPCKNIAQSENDFILDPKDYFNTCLKSDIIAVVHSHPNGSPEPSKNDIRGCNATGLDYYIFNYPNMDVFFMEPERRIPTLIGREYSFGSKDCFEACRDFYSQQGIYLPKRENYEKDWWKKGLNYFNKEYIESWGFKETEVLKPNNLLIFNICSTVPNHCGVYLGDNLFFHHAVDRLSCREPLEGVWLESLSRVYKYET